MQAWVSLWSADLLDVGRAIDLVAERADGFHLDVFDGHNVDELLFGPDFVAAVRRRTTLPLDVHLNVTDPDHWLVRFIDAGADVISVQSAPCPDVRSTLTGIRDLGAEASLGVESHERVGVAFELRELIDRVLLMGTPIGVKGVGLVPGTYQRVTELAGLTTPAGDRIPIFVDGGIRPHTVAELAHSGADGVIPGSLVFTDAHPCAAITRLHNLPGPDKGSALTTGRPTLLHAPDTSQPPQ